MRIMRVDNIDWTGAPYKDGDVIYAGPQYGAAIRWAGDGSVTGIGAGPSQDKFIEELGKLIDAEHDLRVERDEARRKVYDLQESLASMAKKNVPTTGVSIADLSDAIVKVIDAVKK